MAIFRSLSLLLILSCLLPQAEAGLCHFALKQTSNTLQRLSQKLGSAPTQIPPLYLAWTQFRGESSYNSPSWQTDSQRQQIFGIFQRITNRSHSATQGAGSVVNGRVSDYELDLLASGLHPNPPPQLPLLFWRLGKEQGESLLIQEARYRQNWENLRIELQDFFHQQNVSIANGPLHSLAFRWQQHKAQIQWAVSLGVISLMPSYIDIIQTYLAPDNFLEAAFLYSLPLTETYLLQHSSFVYRGIAAKKWADIQNLSPQEWLQRYRAQYPLAYGIDTSLVFLQQSLRASLSLALVAAAGAGSYLLTEWLLEKEISPYFYQAFEKNQSYQQLLIRSPNEIDSLPEIEQLGLREAFELYHQQHQKIKREEFSFSNPQHLKKWFAYARDFNQSSLQNYLIGEFLLDFRRRHNRDPDFFSDADMQDFANFLNERSEFRNPQPAT